MCHSLRKEAALEFGGTRADTSVLLARRRQGEQAVAMVGIVFWYPSGSAQAPHRYH